MIAGQDRKERPAGIRRHLERQRSGCRHVKDRRELFTYGVKKEMEVEKEGMRGVEISL